MRRFVVIILGAAALAFSACTPPTTGGGGGTPTNRAPVAAISADPTSGYAPLDVQFSSAGSTDDSGIVSYSWDFGDESDPATTGNPSHVYESAGIFTATVTVTDAAGLTDDASIAVVVTLPPNTPPEAHAAADVTGGKAPLAVEFSSAGTVDPDGSISGLAWDFGDDETSTEANPSHVYTAPGNYLVSLTATDDDGDSDTATVSITVVANQPPTAAAACTPVSGKVPLAVTCSSAGSNDSDGDITGYAWDFGDGGTSTDAEATHTFDTASATPYDVTLTVTDDNGDSASDVTTVTVNANQGPTAVANATPLGTTAPLDVEFDGSLSSDLDGGVTSYSWAFGDGGTSTDASPTHTYTTSGSHVATLTVADAEGLTDAATVTVVVDNTSPTAAASCLPASGKFPLEVECSSAGSNDSDGDITGYAWDFGDGGTSTDADPTHLFTDPGDYTVALVVTDNGTATAAATSTVHVAANVAPTAVAAADPLVGREALDVDLTAGDSTDSDGTIVSYEWDFGDGDSDTGEDVTHTYAAAGEYTAELTVTDDNGDSATDSVVITVNENQAPTAVANAPVQTAPAPFTVSFEGHDSVDPDARPGESLDFAWDFDGDGSSTDADPSHTFTTIGDHVVTLTVTDENGATDSATLTIHVLTFTDADGDGYAVEGNGTNPGVDCADGDAAINPGAADPFDVIGTDTNCDGVDGVVADAYFVATTGTDGPTCGPIGSPCATVGQGVTRAAADSKSVLDVTSGSYAESVSLTSLTSALTIRGGYSGNFSSQSGTTTVTGSGGPAFTAGGTTAAIRLLDLTATGASGAAATGVLVSGTSNVTLERTTINSGAATGAAASAYGVRATSGATVAIADSTVTAAAATAASASTATGPAGAATCVGNIGRNHNGTPDNGGGASCGGVAGSTLSGAGGKGGASSSSAPGSPGLVGGAGAAGGIGGVYACFGSSDNPGKGGAGGLATPAGGAGSAGGSGTTSAGATWLGLAGGTGGTGGNGGGGGGAGGGGSTCAGTNGAGGGSGGGGGTGGGGGGGGAAGGGSFAVYAFSSTVTVTNSTLTANAGGNGGAGAAGGVGGNGGKGGNGGNTNTSLQAGAGGGGGGGAAGSGGGGGGGGAGGPSISAFHTGTGGLTVTGGTLNKAATAAGGGGGGALGTGGTAGALGSGGDGNTGNDGLPGTAGAAGTAGTAGTAGIAGLRCSKFVGGVCTP